MPRRLTLPVLAAVALVCGAAVWTPGVRVVDGDTVDAGPFRYRLEGIDTPELHNSRCDRERELARLARDRLQALIDSADGRWRPEPVHPFYDKYHSSRPPWLRRRLARIWVDGRDAGAVLVAEGLARPYDGGSNVGWCP